MDQTYSVNSHPYFPQHASVPDFVPNTTPISILLGSFGSIIAIVVFTSLGLAKRVNRSLGTYDQLALCWFVLCGFLHLFFEGYFVLNHASLTGSQTLFAQLWKEYSLSDSRYMTSDPFMLCIESLTVALWGPLCVAIAVCIAKGSHLRTPLQAIMCVGHLYGVLLYYGTCFYEAYYRGVSHSRPEALYYWVYFVGMNFPWIVVPIVLLKDSVMTTYRTTKALESKLSGLGSAVDQTKGGGRGVGSRSKDE